MKTTTLAGIILCALPAAHAQNQPEVVAPKAKISGAASTTLRSSYFVSSGDELHDGLVLQSDLVLSHADLPGWSLIFWHSLDLEGGSDSGSFGNEFDVVVSKEWTLSDSLSLTVSLAYYDEPAPKLFGLGSEDIFVPEVALTKKFGKWTTSAKAALYVPFEGGEEPWLLSVGASRDVLGVNVAAELAYDTGGFGADSGFVSSVALTKSWELGRGWSLNAEATVWLPFTGDRRKAELVWGIGVSKKF